MSRSLMPHFLAIALFVTGGLATPSIASIEDAGLASEDLLDGILRDVIDRTLDAAREEVRRNTWVDPADPADAYQPVPADASAETRRELDQLYAEHDREIAKLEAELDHKLGKAESEFEREAAKEDETKKIVEKRAKLEEKVDKAYAKFEEKIDEKNARFAEKRDKILRERRDG